MSGRWLLLLWPRQVAALPRFDSKSRSIFAARIQDIARDIKPRPLRHSGAGEHCASSNWATSTWYSCREWRSICAVAGWDGARAITTRFWPRCRARPVVWRFDEQIIGAVPVEPHDRRVNCVLTPTRWIEALKKD